MGLLNAPTPLLSLCFLFFFLFTTTSFIGAADSNDDNGKNTTNSTPSPPPPPPPPTPPSSSISGLEKSNFSPFRPGIAVIVGILTTMFSITFLLLLYAKHCKRGSGVASYAGNPNTIGNLPSSATARKNSGIDRSVIESLPVFRFGSLTGQKEGLECAVCLARFEPAEVLKLLPKCKHAFHVECVETWLDAHSTCPLCRYRVEPEDILLIDESKFPQYNDPPPAPPPEPSDVGGGLRRVSGRHSSAGERGSEFLQVVVERPGVPGSRDPSRRSYDDSRLRKNSESVAVGCFDRTRKDGLLLTEAMTAERLSFERRFEHRIIVSAGAGGFQQRWSDVQPSDLLYLRSEMIIGNGRRRYSPHPAKRRQQEQNANIDENRWSGRSAINSRSVSEITGLSRFSYRGSHNDEGEHRHIEHGGEQQRQAGVVSRWLAWISQSGTAVRSGQTESS